MLTNVDIDDKLMAEAKTASGLKTKKEIVNAGLLELVKHYERLNVMKLRGKAQFWDNYERDLKELRKLGIQEWDLADPS